MGKGAEAELVADWDLEALKAEARMDLIAEGQVEHQRSSSTT